MLEEQLNRLNDLGFQFKKSKDDKERDSIENDVKNIINDLKKNAIEKFQSESDVKKFLDNIIHFNNYSFNNQLLIFLQKPDANYVSAFRTFTKLGYKINKGAKGIKIFIPNFYNIAKIKQEDGSFIYKPFFLLNQDERKIYNDKDDESITFHKQKLAGFSLGNVFDASDTTMPLEAINEELNPVLNNNSADEIMDCFIKTIYNDGFKGVFKDLDGTVKGYCDHANNEIVIKKGLGNISQLKVLIHEYAHALAHKHLENNNKEYQEHRNKYETEAESISYVVSNFIGLEPDTSSLSYLYVYSKEKDFKEIDDSFNTIVNYSKRIISNFNKFYDRKFDLYGEEYSAIAI